ncbi:MAG: RNA methyltransferase [Bryobacteraceae bacterium]
MNETLLSDKNPLLKDVRRAANQGTLTSDGYALAEGPHLLEEALRSAAEIGAIIVAESSRVPLTPAAKRIVHVADATFNGLTTTDTPQGVLALIRPRTWTFDELLHGRALVVILDGIQDPGNAGAILRAAEAFGATGAVFLKGCVNPHNPKCMRASAGSIFRIPLVAGLEAEELLEICRLPLHAADAKAPTVLSEARLAKPCAIIIGSEGRGVSPALAARATGLRIPTVKVESLNAAVAAGILLYEARRQRDGSPT